MPAPPEFQGIAAFPAPPPCRLPLGAGTGSDLAPQRASTHLRGAARLVVLGGPGGSMRDPLSCARCTGCTAQLCEPCRRRRCRRSPPRARARLGRPLGGRPRGASARLGNDRERLVGALATVVSL